MPVGRRDNLKPSGMNVIYLTKGTQRKNMNALRLDRMFLLAPPGIDGGTRKPNHPDPHALLTGPLYTRHRYFPCQPFQYDFISEPDLASSIAVVCSCLILESNMVLEGSDYLWPLQGTSVNSYQSAIPSRSVSMVS